MSRVNQAAPVLKNRTFLALWAGQTISHLGDVLYSLALMWWVLQVTESGVAMSSIALAGALPRIFLGPLAGVYIDRLDRRKLLLYTNVIFGVVTLAIAWLFVHDIFSLPLMIASTVLFGILSSFATPAFEAAIPAVVGREQLVQANSLMQSARSFIGLGAPALSGIVLGVFGIGASVFINALTFLAAAFSLVIISFPSPQVGAQSTSVWKDSATGFRFIFSHSMLWPMLLFFAVVNLSLSPMGVVMPLFVAQVLAGGPTLMGLFGSFQSAGFLAGASLASAFPRLLRRTGLTLILFIMGIGMGIGIMGLWPHTITFLGGALLLGISLVGANLASQTIWQSEVPDSIRGRVFAARHSFSSALQPLGMGLSGILVDYIGSAQLLSISGLLCIAVVSLGFLVPGLVRYCVGSTSSGEREAEAAC